MPKNIVSVGFESESGDRVTLTFEDGVLTEVSYIVSLYTADRDVYIDGSLKMGTATTILRHRVTRDHGWSAKTELTVSRFMTNSDAANMVVDQVLTWLSWVLKSMF